MKRFIINPKGRVFITGATEYVGAAIAKKLVHDNYEVLAMSRSEESDKKLFALGCTPIRSEIFSITAADVANCNCIIHAAILLRQCTNEIAAFENFCLVGTQNLMTVAKTAGVEKFIYIANENLFGHGNSLENIDEYHPMSSLDSNKICPSIKQQTEQLVLDANEENTFETISIRPRLIWGENNSPLLRRIRYLAERNKIYWVDKGIHVSNFTHIDNLVKGVTLAMKNGKGANAYFITDDEVISFKDFIIQYLDNQKIKTEGKEIPNWLIKPLIGFYRRFDFLMANNKSLKNATYGIELTSSNYTVSTQKARIELAYVPIINFKDGMARLRKVNIA